MEVDNRHVSFLPNSLEHSTKVSSLTEIHFMQLPFTIRCSYCDVTIFSINKQCIVYILRC
uniref:Uncharacterized protein n=1 Tax=Ciona savignyi TaxID=51511 RepID=H2YBA0_CIOSA